MITRYSVVQRTDGWSRKQAPFSSNRLRREVVLVGVAEEEIDIFEVVQYSNREGLPTSNERDRERQMEYL